MLQANLADAKAERRYVDDTKLATAIGVSVSTIRKDRIDARRIPYIKLGGRVLYDLDAVHAALDALTVGGVAPVAKGRR